MLIVSWVLHGMSNVYQRLYIVWSLMNAVPFQLGYLIHDLNSNRIGLVLETY